MDEEVKRIAGHFGVRNFVKLHAGSFHDLTTALSLLAQQRGKVVVVVPPEMEDEAREIHNRILMKGMTPVILLSESLKDDEVLVGF